MFTDLVGFTRLGQRDEGEALRLRKEHQSLLRPVFAAHGGREVKSLGDGFLVEFPSAVSSVRCAVEIQEMLARRNAASGDSEPIHLRIGIHVGDVVEEDGDILGDAVNVASRIEPLAPPGGVCISGAVYEQVRNKLDRPIEKLGTHSLKNVEFPVDIYRVTISGVATPSSRADASAAPNLRLAVLPFANLSPDAADEFFADGLTDELIYRASQIPMLRVISRTSVRQYKDTSKPIREVGRELGVVVALEGSIRKSGNRVRVAAQLIDTRSEEHLWASRYDRPFDDIFAIQDDIAEQVASSISLHMSGGRMVARPTSPTPSSDTENLEAYSAFLHGQKLFGEKGSIANIHDALELFEKAVRLDPRFARARVGVAECISWLGTEGDIPWVEAFQRARNETAKALELNDGLGEAHSTLAGLMIGADQMGVAEREARRAIELNPSLSDPYRWLAQIEAGNGRIEASVKLLESAFQVNPLDVNVMAFLGRLYFYAGREDEALAFWQRTKPIVAYRTNQHLTEYFLSRGRLDEAETTVRELERIRPGVAATLGHRGMLSARRGDVAAARKALEELSAKGHAGGMSVFYEGFVHLALGEEDAFFDCLNKALDLHQLPLLELLYSPMFREIRDDPRFRDLLRRQYEQVDHSA